MGIRQVADDNADPFLCLATSLHAARIVDQTKHKRSIVLVTNYVSVVLFEHSKQ